MCLEVSLIAVAKAKSILTVWRLVTARIAVILLFEIWVLLEDPVKIKATRRLLLVGWL